VSKTRSVAEISAVYGCGVRHFGENRVEEAEVKIPALRAEWAADPATWHLIGHVQGRKAKRAIEVADLIHAVDSLALAERLDRLAGEAGVRVPILLELNVSGEESKYGLRCTRATCRELAEQLQPLGALRHVEVRGLMTMAPIVADPELARPVFRELVAIREAWRECLPFSTWTELSMGMTDDFEVASEEGATRVRIGRAIFGPSTY